MVNEEPEQIAPEFTEIIGDVFVEVVFVIIVPVPELLILVVLNKLTVLIVVVLTDDEDNKIPVAQLTILLFNILLEFVVPCNKIPIFLPQVELLSIIQLLEAFIKIAVPPEPFVVVFETLTDTHPSKEILVPI